MNHKLFAFVSLASRGTRMWPKRIMCRLEACSRMPPLTSRAWPSGRFKMYYSASSCCSPDNILAATSAASSVQDKQTPSGVNAPNWDTRLASVNFSTRKKRKGDIFQMPNKLQITNHSEHINCWPRAESRLRREFEKV